MKVKQWFVKVSGLTVTSHSAIENLTREMIALLKFDKSIHVTIVPGGGDAVDDLRANFNKMMDTSTNKEKEIQAEYHWRSIDIMDTNANRFRKCFELQDRVSVPSIRRTLETSSPELPETWDVTSDSITYWLACRDRTIIPTIVLLKEVDGVILPPTGNGIPRRTQQPAGTIIKEIKIYNGVPIPPCPSYPFDTFLFKLVDRYHAPFYVVNSRHLERLRYLAAFKDDFPFTRIMHEERNSPAT